MKTLLALGLALASLLIGSQGEDHLGYNPPHWPISHADYCFNMPCENPEWKRQTCCEGYICIQPEIYEPVQTPRCINEQKQYGLVDKAPSQTHIKLPQQPHK